MWKVKRMNTACIVVLTIAIGAGGIAATLASGFDHQSAASAAPIAQLQTLQRQIWPAMAATSNFIYPRGESAGAVAYGIASPQPAQTRPRGQTI
jgi:pilus assembly protein CpaB